MLMDGRETEHDVVLCYVVMCRKRMYSYDVDVRVHTTTYC
jgi:hypothetical protein